MADKILRGSGWKTSQKRILHVDTRLSVYGLIRSLNLGVGGISKLQNPYGPSVEWTSFWTYLKRRQNYPSLSEYHNDEAFRPVANHTGPGIHILLSFG